MLNDNWRSDEINPTGFEIEHIYSGIGKRYDSKHVEATDEWDDDEEMGRDILLSSIDQFISRWEPK
jgi:hypothetical protein